MTPATEWDLQLMDFALEVAHLFPELAMSPAEIEATIHEAELKIEPEEETPDTANWATCCSRPLLWSIGRGSPRAVTRTESFLQDCTGMKWRSDRPAAPQSLRSLIGKTVPAPQGLTGLYGIEAECNAQLTGTMGQRQDVVDTRGRRLSGAAAQPAIDGRTVTMTLDLIFSNTPQHNCKKQWHPATPPVDG